MLVLEVGCGNSRLGEELLWAGVACGVTCIDLSTVAVQRMCDSLAELGTSGVVVMVADMLDLPFDSESFDLRERDHEKKKKSFWSEESRDAIF